MSMHALFAHNLFCRQRFVVLAYSYCVDTIVFCCQLAVLFTYHPRVLVL